MEETQRRSYGNLANFFICIDAARTSGKGPGGAFFDLGCFSPAFRSVFKHYLFLVDAIELSKLLNELTKLDVSINGLQVDALD